MCLEAWYMDDSDEDQRKPHRLNPNQPVSLDQLKKLGVFYWKVNTHILQLSLSKQERIFFPQLCNHFGCNRV